MVAAIRFVSILQAATSARARTGEKRALNEITKLYLRSYDLFIEDGQAGHMVHPTETGLMMRDVLRFNRSCIARVCPKLTAPENGRILSTGKVCTGNILELNCSSDIYYRHPVVVEFQCEMGYRLVGSRKIECRPDGSWNDTAPTCQPAFCTGRI